jgi:peptidoglycan/LPS O-acetylase OafA/YrhL
MSSSPHRLTTVDALRGVASLSVCWYHLTNGNANFLPDGLLKSSGAYGWLGVEIFFVISGFIIPYSLYRSSYHVSAYGTFLLKRIIRLDPPYLVSIIIVIALRYVFAALPGLGGTPFHFSLVQFILHIGYINVFFGHPWLNPVFWTLAIELQYYLLAGLLFFVIAHRSPLVRALAFLCLAGLALSVSANQFQFLFHWLFLFMLGMAAFQLRTGILKLRMFILWVAALGIGAWYVNGLVISATGVVTSLAIALFEIGVKEPLLFFGHVSYSLYLLHIPVGMRIANLSQRFVHTIPGKTAVLAAALATSIAAAWLLHRYVERPAQRWASGILYRNRRIPASGFADATLVSREPAR